MGTIDKSLAKGLRHQYATGTERYQSDLLAAMIAKNNDVPFVKMLRDAGVYSGERRRIQTKGIKKGTDVAYIEYTPGSGELHIVQDALNKCGELIPSSGPLFLTITRHAVESLYQRLKTLA